MILVRTKKVLACFLGLFLVALITVSQAQATYVLRRARDMTAISRIIQQVAPNGFVITPLDNGSIYLEPRGHILRIDAFMDNRNVHFFRGDIFRYAPHGSFTVWWDRAVDLKDVQKPPTPPASRPDYLDPVLFGRHDAPASQTPGQGYYSAAGWNGGYARPSAP